MKKWLQDFSHLFFPHQCLGCGADSVPDKDFLCMECLLTLPETGFFQIKDNLVEQKFRGRVPILHAGSAYYFTKHSALERLIYALKYRGNGQVGNYLGSITGQCLLPSGWIQDIDAIIPLPLHRSRLQTRGYNQAEKIAEGIATILQKPVWPDVIARTKATATQTHKNRVERVKSMEDIFAVTRPERLENKHLLLVDDIITTGATLDFCATELLRVAEVRLSIATVGCTIH